jgi:restriction system protein
MKLRMAKNSLFAILLRSPWWMSMAVVAVIVLLSGALLPKAYVPFGVMGAFPFLAIGIMAAWRQMRAPNPARVAAALARAGTLSWRDFSALLETAYVRQGYTVTRLNSAVADFSLSKDGQTQLISAKRWKAANQGVEVLRDLVALRDARGAQQCSHISLNPLTDIARRFAQTQGVHLTTEIELAELIDHV